MNLSMQMILDGLGEAVVIQHGRIQEPPFIAAAARLQKNQTCFEPDILYVGSVSDLPESPPLEGPVHGLLVCDGSIPPAYTGGETLRLVVVDSRCDPAGLLARVKRRLDERRQYCQAAERLFQALISGQGIQHILDVAAELLENPVKIGDRSFKTLASSRSVPTDDYFWQTVSERGSAPVELVKSASFREHIRQVYRTDEPVVSPSENSTQHNILACRVTVSGRIIGHVAVLDNSRPFTPLDFELVRLLCRVISDEMQKDDFFQHTKGLIFEFFITDLLNGKDLHPEVVAERVKYLDLDLKENLYVLVVRFAKIAAENPSLSYVRSLIESLLNENRSVIYNDSIVLLVSREAKRPLLPDELNSLVPALKENHLVVGVSWRFERIAGIRKYYHQANKAIEMGLHLDGDHTRCLFPYDQYALYDLIDLAAGQQELRGFCNPLVFELIDYDQKNNTTLSRSLAEFLNSRDNFKEAAFALGIHRNTLDYRLKKIEEILNVSLSDPDTHWSLHLSYKILELLDGKQAVVR